MLTSDGVTEAGNRSGVQFGGDRLEALLAGVAGSAGDAPTAVFAALDDFRDGTPFADDVSVVELVFEPTLLGESAPVRPMFEEVMA